jgi:hypothetical protein
MADYDQTPLHERQNERIDERQDQSIAAQLNQLREIIARQQAEIHAEIQAQINALRSEMATRTEVTAVQQVSTATESAGLHPQRPRPAARAARTSRRRLLQVGGAAAAPAATAAAALGTDLVQPSATALASGIG